MSRVLFQANWCPQYRVPFYNGLREELDLRGIRLDLTYGAPPRKFRARGDHQPIEWGRRRRQWMPGTARAELQFDPVHLRKTYDLVVVEFIAKQVNTYLQLLLHGVGVGPKVAFFGHGAVDRTPSTAIARSLKKAVASSSDGWLVYTEQGREALESYGVEAGMIHVLNNTIDASGLREACLDASARKQAIRRQIGLGDGPIILHIGGLDGSKRLNVVLAAFSLIKRSIPDAELVIAGTGSSAPDVARAAEADPAIHFLGPVFGDRRGELFAVSALLLHPGKVGLVVIDSFATGVPLVAAKGQLQAPEFDYLDDEVAVLVEEPDAELVAATAVELLRNPERLAELASRVSRAYGDYDMGSMILRAANGIESLVRGRGDSTRADRPSLRSRSVQPEARSNRPGNCG